MAKYKERVISGSEWIQLGKAKFNFSINTPTRVVFNEELVTQMSVDSVDIKANREIETILVDLSTKFILVDPANNTPTGGDMSYRQLERAIYSLYYAKAQELDASTNP